MNSKTSFALLFSLLLFFVPFSFAQDGYEYPYDYTNTQTGSKGIFSNLLNVGSAFLAVPISLFFNCLTIVCILPVSLCAPGLGDILVAMLSMVEDVIFVVLEILCIAPIMLVISLPISCCSSLLASPLMNLCPVGYCIECIPCVGCIFQFTYGLWSSAKMMLNIICGCIPCVRYLPLCIDVCMRLLYMGGST